MAQQSAHVAKASDADQTTEQRGQRQGSGHRGGGMASLVGPLAKDLLHFLTTRHDPVAAALSVNDMREVARRRTFSLPFSYADSAAEDEETANANVRAFDEVTLRPHLLVDATDRDLSVTVLGRNIALPVILDPTGMPGIQNPGGELAAARAAHHAGTIFSVSTAGNYAVTDVAAASPGPLWYQLYPWGEPKTFLRFVDLAKSAGCEALIVTLDAATGGNRESDARTGFLMPPKVTRANVSAVLHHPVKAARWLHTLTAGPGIILGNEEASGPDPEDGSTPMERAMSFEQNFVPSFTAEKLQTVRRRWGGPVILKGITTAEQAQQAHSLGADAVIVSNHGGRQLDGLPSTLRALPRIADTLAGTGVEVLLDGGIRRGTDVVKALSLGARACLIGRPWVWGLAAGGERGVTRVLDILREEFDRDLVLMGRTRPSELDRSAVDAPADWFSRA